MNLKSYLPNNALDSLLVFWKTVIQYHTAILKLWRTMQLSGIHNKIIVDSLQGSYEVIHTLIELIIRRCQVTEFQRVPSIFFTLIKETEQLLNDTYTFSHSCFSSLYNVKRITYLQTNILNNLIWLQTICELKREENNPHKKWLSSTVFNPSTAKGGSE